MGKLNADDKLQRFLPSGEFLGRVRKRRSPHLIHVGTVYSIVLDKTSPPPPSLKLNNVTVWQSHGRYFINVIFKQRNVYEDAIKFPRVCYSTKFVLKFFIFYSNIRNLLFCYYNNLLFYFNCFYLTLPVLWINGLSPFIKLLFSVHQYMYIKSWIVQTIWTLPLFIKRKTDIRYYEYNLSDTLCNSAWFGPWLLP